MTVRALPEGSLAFPGVSVLRSGWVDKRWGVIQEPPPPPPPALELIARPPGATAAGVRATPSGTAAGDSPAVSGQLR